MMDLEKLFSHTSLQCQWRLKMIFRLMTMMGIVGLLNALATFQWHISYIIYRLYTRFRWDLRCRKLFLRPRMIRKTCLPASSVHPMCGTDFYSSQVVRHIMLTSCATRLLNALATFQWHISYIIYRLYTTYVQYRQHVWSCETCWHNPSVHVWNH